MKPGRLNGRGFTLLELLMAMALFAIAAVSLAGALNLISLTVAESIDDAELRERLRGTMLEATRDPALKEDSRETNPDERGLYFRIEVVRVDLKTQEGRNIENLFEVTVTAIRETAGGRRETLDQASTFANPNLL
jgi:prepilin-type N-terminal cleavage/methylation domain-containing protein